jgi:hypothetical protein
MYTTNISKTIPESLLAKLNGPSLLKARAEILQIVAKTGAGARRIALPFLSRAFKSETKKIIWISQHWNLYAPLLWKIAEENKIQLLGVDLNDKKRLRFLWRCLLEGKVFDGWVLDNLHLSTAEGLFLQKLTRLQPLKILVLDEKPHLFCTKRAHLHLSHHHYRLSWTKGENKPPEFFSSPLLQLFANRAEGANIKCLP